MKPIQINITLNILIFSSILIGGYFIIVVSLLFHRQSPNAAIPIDPPVQKIDVTTKNQLIYQQKEINRLKSLLSDKEVLPVTNLPTDASTQADSLNYGIRPGVIVLGMHRSGTSVIGGLISKMGLKTGGPLIGPAEDNKKGFFERVDVVLQNDEIMSNQRVHYSFHTHLFDTMTAIKHMINIKDDKQKFGYGQTGLAFLNNPHNYPWMLKDPRLCITFRAWLPFLNFVPAILFTYRHPMDVALSMHKRGFEQFEIQKGLKLWYVYNRRAIEQSHDLCRVTASHRLIMTQARVELDRIYNQLMKCGVKIPKKLLDNEINSFIDIKLQHGKTTLVDTSCENDISKLSIPTTWETNNPDHLILYREAMRVYCALENHSAYNIDFQWDYSIKD
eukprot:gene12174-16304_t